jgi:hypothetical protein
MGNRKINQYFFSGEYLEISRKSRAFNGDDK